MTIQQCRIDYFQFVVLSQKITTQCFIQIKQSLLSGQTFKRLSDKQSQINCFPWKFKFQGIPEQTHTVPHVVTFWCRHASTHLRTASLYFWLKSYSCRGIFVRKTKALFWILYKQFCPFFAEIPWLQGREEALRISPPETVLHQTAHLGLRRLSGVFVALPEHLFGKKRENV